MPRLLVGASMIFARSGQSLLGEDDGRMAGSRSNDQVIGTVKQLALGIVRMAFQNQPKSKEKVQEIPYSTTKSRERCCPVGYLIQLWLC